jgi:hypothetical protein
MPSSRFADQHMAELWQLATRVAPALTGRARVCLFFPLSRGRSAATPTTAWFEPRLRPAVDAVVFERARARRV